MTAATRDAAAVVVIDDDEHVREQVSSLLTKAGCQVCSFESGKPALEFLRQTPVDVVLTDVRMPEMSGLTLLEHMRDSIPDLPAVIFMTGYMDHTIEDTYLRGAAAVLAKPIPPADIIRTVKFYGEKKQRERRRASYVDNLQEHMVLSERHSSVGQVTLSVAEELALPLGVIQGSLDRLAELSGTDEKVQNHLNKAVLALHRAQDIVQGLQSISGIKESVDERGVYVTDILQDTLNFCRPQLKQARVRLQYEPEEVRGMLVCDSRRVAQILLKLLLNACASVKGQVEPWIRIAVEETDSDVVIQVSDSGPTPRPEIRQQLTLDLMDPYVFDGGQDLGIFLARQLTNTLGGSLKVDEKSLHSCFVLRLPMAVRRVSEIKRK